VLSEIAPRVGLSVISLGSGPGGDIDYLFQEDICGETPTRPRHARAFGDLLTLAEHMQRERIAALSAYRTAVTDGSFPAAAETVGIKAEELAAFRDALG
ncbi:MAG: 3-methyl-2-oxobutanoate hydroxymethyltransferase, partial [Rhodobacteraceae bacterium]|nr:3-methyl-2-oxobutanoate hydroxymethyltransferase [Paracoccaceae bacterium]